MIKGSPSAIAAPCYGAGRSEGLVLSPTTEQEDLADGTNRTGCDRTAGNQDGDEFRPSATPAVASRLRCPGFIGVVPGEHCAFASSSAPAPLIAAAGRCRSACGARGWPRDWTRPNRLRGGARRRDRPAPTTPRPYGAARARAGPCTTRAGSIPTRVHETYGSHPLPQRGSGVLHEIEMEVVSVEPGRTACGYARRPRAVDVAPEVTRR